MKQLEKLIEIYKTEQFNNPNNVCDAEALGLMISHYFEWDGSRIKDVAYFAFEDSNFHSLNEGLNKLWEFDRNKENSYDVNICENEKNG